MENKSEYKIILVFLIVILFTLVYVAAETDITITPDDGKNPVVTYPFDFGQPNEMEPVTLVDGYSKISYNNNGDSNDKREFANIAIGGKFIFKNKKLNSSDFVATKDSEYVFGNQKIKVPKDSHVIFKNNKVTIELPKNAVIEKPIKIPNSKEEDVKVEYRYKQGEEPSTVKIRDSGKEYDIKKFGSERFQINYDGKVDAFRVDGDFEMRGVRIGEYSKEDETYLFFDGGTHNDLKGSYVSFGDKKLIVGASSGKFGSTVQFLSGNGVIDVRENAMMMVQAIGGDKGGHLTFESRDSGKIPIMTATGGYNLFSGSKVLKYIDSYKDKYKGPGILTSNPLDFSKKESIPLQVVTLDNSGKRIGDWDVVVDSYNSIRAGNAQQLENQLTGKIGGVVTSIRASFHSLTKEEQEKLGTLSLEKQRELIGADVNKLKEEIKKIPSTPTPPSGTTPTPPGTKPDTKPGTTPTPPIKIGDKIKDSDKDKYKSILKNNGIMTSAKGSFAGEYNEITTKDGKKQGYIFSGQFSTSSGTWSSSNLVQKVAIINKDIYIYQKSPYPKNSNIFSWVKYKTIK